VARRTAEIEIPQADKAEGCPHPRETYDLLGHEQAEKTFLKAQTRGRLHHAWLITGPSGVGKATLAYRMIRHLLGGVSLLGEGLDIPASDPVAGRIAAQGHGNLHVVRRPYDHKTKKIKAEIPVAAIRTMTDFFHETASEEGRPRIGLIDKADELNRSSENAVLKLLEEPPNGGMLILLSDAPGRLLPTIRSRCMSLDLRPVPEAQLSAWLAARTAVKGEALKQLVWLSRGSPGRAMALLQAEDEVLEPLLSFAQSLTGGRRVMDLAVVSKLSGAKVARERALFWAGLQDLLAGYARAGAGEAWNAPFPQPNTESDWAALHTEAVARERLESAINMDQRASLLDFITQVRAA